MEKELLLDRIKGTIYGQAIGDALGLGTEFMNDDEMARKYPNGITHYTDIYQDYHRKRWNIGDWTDDTDMMLCIATAVIKDNGVNYTSIAQNFEDWLNGVPMGIGSHTFKVLTMDNYVEHPHEVSRLIWELSGRNSAANGALMRTSIVGLLPNHVVESAENICKLTHYDPRCVGSCVIISSLIHALVFGKDIPTYNEIAEIGRRYDARIEEYLALSLNGDIKQLDLQNDNSMGYTLKTLAAALWAYWHAGSFQDGLLKVVRAGGDADTNSAVACAVLGAKFGFHSIPQEYVSGLVYREQLDEVVGGMYKIIDKICTSSKT